MQEGHAIAIWSSLLGGGFLGAVWLLNDPPHTEARRPTAMIAVPAPSPVSPVPAFPEHQVATVPVRPAEPKPEPPPAITPTVPSASVKSPAAAPTPAPPAKPALTTATAPAAPAARPLPDFPVIPPGPKAGDNAEARRYTDALNALSTEGYSGVDRIAPDGERFRATAIMEGQRFEVLIDPHSGQIQRLSRPR